MDSVPTSERPPPNPPSIPYPWPLLPLLEPYLPPQHSPRTQSAPDGSLPFVTLTYAASLDGRLAQAPGVRMRLSGPESKALTHLLRSRHDAILVGVSTAVADDPALNCRLEGAAGFGGHRTAGTEPRLQKQDDSYPTNACKDEEASSSEHLRWQPRPIIVDPSARWQVTSASAIIRTAHARQGLAPWIIVASDTRVPADRQSIVERAGSRYISIGNGAQDDGLEAGRSITRTVNAAEKPRLSWRAILRRLASEGIRSIMIEGGATVLNAWLEPALAPLVSSTVITVAPTYLGPGGPTVSPQGQGSGETSRRKTQEREVEESEVSSGRTDHLEHSRQPPIRFADVKWIPLGEDAVMCGRRPEQVGTV